MLDISYTLDNPLEEFLQLSSAIGGNVQSNKWTFDNAYAKGYMEYYELDKGLFLYLYNDIAFQPISISRLPAAQNTCFIINYDLSGADVSVNSSRAFSELGANSFDGILFASSKTKAMFKQPLNKQIKGVKIVFHKNWIENHAGAGNDDENQLILNLLEADHPIYLYEYIDFRSLELVKEIFLGSLNAPFLKIKLLAYTIELLHIFFSRIIRREYKLNHKFHYTDLGNIFEARELLIGDFSQHCPTISVLAQKASMSETKFTKMFKNVFGQSTYRYYQTSRMRKAYSLLESGKFSAQEVAELIGYQHPGKFSEAFKKQYNRSPKEILSDKSILEQN